VLSARERLMERVDQVFFYSLGKTFQEIMAKNGEVGAANAFMPLLNARGHLVRLLSGNPIKLVIAHSMASSLRDSISVVIDRYFTKIEDNERKLSFPSFDDPPIPGWEWGWIHDQISKFETVLQEELAQTSVYYVPQRGIFDTASLVDAADRHFPASVLAVLPAKAKDEWRAAGRCLAFNLLSACGFHVARAVESVAEVYYQSVCSQPGKTLKSWHEYIDALSRVPVKSDAHNKIIAELKQMKDDYRNPIMHPRITLEEFDARMIFANGESLIIAMVQELQRAPTTAAAGLTIVSSQGSAVVEAMAESQS
jgi:hypothetical protein